MVRKWSRRVSGAGNPSLANRLDAEQQGMKITASSTSYGALIELNVEALSKPKIADAYGRDGSFLTEIDRVEKAGRYFHPLPATLITSAARLMLAIAERLAYEHQLDWALMDTDSIAFTNPHDLPTREFHDRVDQIRAWFQPLNPYRKGGDLLELEDVNYALKPRRHAIGRPPGTRLLGRVAEALCAVQHRRALATPDPQSLSPRLGLSRTAVPAPPGA